MSLSTVLDRPAVTPEPTTTDDELVICVTQEDIDNGHQADATACAIALAAQRQGGDGWWRMQQLCLWFEPRNWDSPHEYWHSPEAERFVRAFDRDRHSVQPTRLVFRRDSAAGSASQ